LQNHPSLNFYVVTGRGDQVEAEIPPDLPVRGVLSKPFDSAEIGRIITTTAEQTKLARQRKINQMSFGLV
jgi:hypothetical protein